MGWVSRRRSALFLGIFVFALSAYGNPSTCAQFLSTFGYEVEYVQGENPQLWTLYRPENISEAEWRAIPMLERDRVIRTHTDALAPTRRVPARLVRLSTAPEYLPERLIRDDTGNWEIVGGISTSYVELEHNMRTLERGVGPGSYQAHVVSPIESLQRGAAGYTLFSADLLAFRKLVSQLARHEEDPRQIPGAFFSHSFLSVFSQIKKEMLVATMEANLQGRGWRTVVPEFRQRYPHLHEAWAEDRPYYKYTLANTYRTDIYGNTPERLIRWGFEVRGAHKNLEALLTEVRVIETLMHRGFSGFDRFLDLRATDTLSFDQAFNPSIRLMLRESIAEVERDDPKPNYFVFLLRPFEQYADFLSLNRDEAATFRRDVLRARTNALEALQSIADRFQANAIDKQRAKSESMVLLARFCRETNLLPLLEQYQASQITEQDSVAVTGP